MSLRRNKIIRGALDITPLVDLVFLLIIFFLLSTTFRITPGIKIDLPQASIKSGLCISTKTLLNRIF